MATQSEIFGFQRWLLDNQLRIGTTGATYTVEQQRQSQTQDDVLKLAHYRGMSGMREVWVDVHAPTDQFSRLSRIETVLHYVDGVNFDKRSDFALMDAH